MNTKNLKDKISNYSGIVLLVSGIVLSIASAGVALPAFLVTSATVGATASGSVLAYLTGKNPNLSPKSKVQVWEENTKK